MDRLNDIKCFCLDMDGTIYLSDVLIDGALSAIERMQSQARVLFLTNNSSKTRTEYLAKLHRLGLKVSAEDIYGSGNATIDYLNTNHSGKSVYLLGSDALKSEFLAGGINLCDSGCAQVAVLAFDKTLTYKKLEDFCRLIDNGAFFVATHPDKTCPTKSGYIPDVGSFLSLIRCVTGKSPSVICGKPSKEYGRRILKMTGVKPCEIAMIGDRLSTDMKFAHNCGFGSVLVLSGEATLRDIERLRAAGKRLPDMIINSIADWDKL